MPNLSAVSFVLSALVVLALGAWTSITYRNDLAAHRERLQGVSRIIETSAGRIEYAEVGTGPPLLIVHGAGGGFDQGMELGKSFATRGFKVIAMSRFGYLRTPLPPDHSPAAQAEGHAALMDALGIQRAALLGVSAGAPSVLQFAVRHADRCLALALMVPMAYSPSDRSAGNSKMTPFAEKMLMTIVGSDFVFWLGSKFARDVIISTVLGTPPEAVRGASAAEQKRVDRILDNILPISDRAQGIINDAHVSGSLTRLALERIRSPTFVLGVRDDRFGAFAGAQYTAAQISGGKFLSYPHGGHVWVGHHDQVVADVEAFLKLSLSAVELSAKHRALVPREQ
jgi:pimeloyl-ACP methyl ester carboxylesterase